MNADEEIVRRFRAKERNLELLTPNDVADLAVVISAMRKRIKEWQRWTPDEDKYIREHASFVLDKEMAEVLGRTERGVKERRLKLGVQRPTK